MNQTCRKRGVSMGVLSCVLCHECIVSVLGVEVLRQNIHQGAMGTVRDVINLVGSVVTGNTA